MRHSYAGDEGDDAKLALLRALTRDRRLGVNGYLTLHPEGDGQPGRAFEIDVLSSRAKVCCCPVAGAEPARASA